MSTPLAALPAVVPICGHRRTGASGIRWVCVAAPHGPRDPQPLSRLQRIPAESHHYVRVGLDPEVDAR